MSKWTGPQLTGWTSSIRDSVLLDGMLSQDLNTLSGHLRVQVLNVAILDPPCPKTLQSGTFPGSWG